MMAEKLWTPNIPKLETVNVPPDNSVGKSFYCFAFSANVFTFFEISSSPFRLVA